MGEEGSVEEGGGGEGGEGGEDGVGGEGGKGDEGGALSWRFWHWRSSYPSKTQFINSIW